ncbi:MAG: cell division protein FtsZ [bacterium]
MQQFVTLDRENENSLSPILKVVGVGGGGCNALDYMIKKGLKGVEYVSVNTDAQALDLSSAHQKVQIGLNLTKGLGAGADPETGKKALEEDREKIKKVVEGANMVFIAAGMGGGTGTGAAPLIASIARSLGILVVGIVTKPFKWEGKKRMMNAEKGINELSQHVDSMIVIPNNRLINLIEKGTTAKDAFEKPNEVLYQATRGIADIITMTGIINVDFADVKSVMANGGAALMGIGTADGEQRAVQAAENSISSPLLEGLDIRGAKKLLLNVTSSSSLTMEEIELGNEVIYKAAGDDADIIFGWVCKDEMNESVSYTVIATGFSSQKELTPSVVSNTVVTPKIIETPEVKINYGNAYKIEKSEERVPVIPTNSEDLKVPAFFRNRGQEPLKASGYKPEMNYTEETNIQEEHSFHFEDQEEDRTFLKRMMD